MYINQFIRTLPVFLISAVLSINLVHAQKKKAPAKKFITVSGKVQFLVPESDIARMGYDYNKVYVGKGSGRKYTAVDSVSVKPDGSYSIKIEAATPTFYRLDFMKWDRIEIWSDGDAVINVRGYDTAKYKIKNPPYIHIRSNSMNNRILNMLNNIDYWNYQDMIAEQRELYYAGQHKSKDSAWISYLNTELEKNRQHPNASDKMLDVIIKDFGEYPAIVKAIQRLNWRKDTATAMHLLDNLIKKYPWHTDAIQLKEDIVTYFIRSKMLENGKEAPLFSYPDPEGNKINLDSFRGKYVLIDFWASWCGPCRAAVPKMKKQYALYKEKGLEIFGVSIDHNENAWRKAMLDENMPWAQVLSPDIDKTMTDYMFSAIPTLYLIGKDGKIMEKYIGYSDELEERLKLIFGSTKP